MQTPNQPIKVQTPVTPTKQPEPTKVPEMTPRRLNFDPTPGKLIQPFEPIDWVYPNDEESQFYTYEQMQNDWVPSDVEDDSSSDEEYNEGDDFTTDEW